jgi:hypothetical protein
MECFTSFFLFIENYRKVTHALGVLLGNSCFSFSFFLFLPSRLCAVVCVILNCETKTLMLQVIDPSLYVAKLEDTQGIEEANVSK